MTDVIINVIYVNNFSLTKCYYCSKLGFFLAFTHLNIFGNLDFFTLMQIQIIMNIFAFQKYISFLRQLTFRLKKNSYAKIWGKQI